jgi:hypothetical protein
MFWVGSENKDEHQENQDPFGNGRFRNEVSTKQGREVVEELKRVFGRHTA